MRALVEIQRRFIIDSESTRAFRDLLSLIVEFSGSEGGFLGKVSSRDGGRYSIKTLVTANLPEFDVPDGSGVHRELFDSPGLDWTQLCQEIERSGCTTFFVPSGTAEAAPGPWWGLPCLNEAGTLVGVVGLAGPQEDCDEELMTTLRALCDLCGVMLDADREEQQKRDLARQAGEARYRSFADHTTNGLFIHDGEGRMVDVNRRACESLGYSREELIGMNPYSFDPDVTPELLAERMERLKRGETISFESRHQRKDGSTFPVELRVSPFQQNDQQYALAIACDITERKQVAAKLKESEAKFRALAINAPVAIFIKDSAGRYTVANPLACEALGRPDGVEGLTDHDLLPKAIADKFRRGDLEVLATGKAMEFEDLVQRQGYSRHYLSVKFPLFDAHGKASAVCGVATDITERKRAEEALRESEERFRALVDISSQIVWTVGADGQVDEPVAAWEAFTGQTFEESIKEGWANVIHPDDRERTLSLWHHCNSTGEPFETEYRLWHAKTQQWRWTSVCGVCLRNPEGEIRSWVGMHNDITERKRSERSLRLTQFSVDHAAVAVFWIGRDSIIRYVNDLACESLRYSREQLVGMSILEITDHTPRSWEERFEQVKQQRSFNVETNHQRSDGTMIPIEVTVHYDEYDGDEFLFAFAQDITDRKEAELKFEQQAAELLHASRLSTVGEMVAALSHEVAQPLSAVGNFAAACEKILSTASTKRRDELSEYIAAILKQNRRCAAILQRLRDYSKRTPDCRTQCDLAHLLRESVELVSSDLRSHDVQVHFDLPQELPTVLANRVQLQQVVVNLLTNARDAVCDEADDRRVITIRAAAERDAVVLNVEDFGRGFEDDGAEHLFEPFYTTKKNGMGIGLSICQSIVHEHGGRIEASSNDAGGASFLVRLPLTRSQQA